VISTTESEVRWSGGPAGTYWAVALKSSGLYHQTTQQSPLSDELMILRPNSSSLKCHDLFSLSCKFQLYMYVATDAVHVKRVWTS